MPAARAPSFANARVCVLPKARQLRPGGPPPWCLSASSCALSTSLPDSSHALLNAGLVARPSDPRAYVVVPPYPGGGKSERGIWGVIWVKLFCFTSLATKRP
jgi:hypothetical protein